MDARWRRRWKAGLAASAFAAVAYVPLQRVALRDLRQLERDYIAAREPTACATQGLVPLAFSDFTDAELDSTLEALISEAREESEAERQRFRRRTVAPIPPVRSAREALAEALDAQVALYDALVEDPQGSYDELKRLGRLNNTFERRAARARNLLLVGQPTGWKQRFICDEEPPTVPPQ